jgi:hypothetical protein
LHGTLLEHAIEDLSDARRSAGREALTEPRVLLGTRGNARSLLKAGAG